MAEDDSDTYWVMSREELQCLGSPRRYDIVDHLAAAGPMSIRDLAKRIGAQPSALYHHRSKSHKRSFGTMMCSTRSWL